MAGKMFAGTMEEMDLVERHILMLKATRENEPVGIIRLSEILNIPRHKVRYSLRLLEQDGLIRATPEGAVVTDRYNEFMNDLSTQLDSVVVRINRLREQVSRK
ncbi:MAG: hypothetical protein PHI87_01265 [Candidatus Methanomethylophilus sp.]|nr:hypothetical protein [Methanomethylophilus sp.]MDD4222084.1 hypothetical protein [Methanomethylophilus sp.]MDD4668250.1 hypothetical protein [Methanomethylophilus sp.]